MRLIATSLLAFLPLLAAPQVDKGKALGSPTAPVTIEIFSDFACPACKTFHENTLPLLMRDYVVRGKVYIVSREFPLNIPGHEHSREAAAYATAAARFNRYSQVADALFRTQADWEKSGKPWDIVAAALTPDLLPKVKALAQDPSVIKAVQDDSNYGTAIGVGQTPTLYLTCGSKRFPIAGYGLEYSLLKSMIDDMAK
jgi:protein-disulfide isomerase